MNENKTNINWYPGQDAIINEVEKYVKNKIEEYKNNSDDHYDFWNEHIKYVYEESLKLADEYNADKEIVALGSLLHDIALINNTFIPKTPYSFSSSSE